MSTPMNPVLEMIQVSKSYGEGPTVLALEDADLARRPGELVAIMGPSGSGKSTMLTIAGTLEAATAGQVLIDGQDTSAMSRVDRARLRRQTIGYVFQDFNLLPGLTAAENVSLPLELDGTRAKAGRILALAALEELGVADRVDRYPDELSGGQRQRVAIARAIVGDRRLLLADEPTGALDSVNGESVMRLVRSACKRGVAGVLVTHDAQLASWADRVVFLRDGRVRRSLRALGRPRVAAVARIGTMSSAAANGGMPARRAVVRWAYRVFRRDWRQHLLILSLLTVAIAAAVAFTCVVVQHRSGVRTVRVRRCEPLVQVQRSRSGDSSDEARRGDAVVRRDRGHRTPARPPAGHSAADRLPVAAARRPVREARAAAALGSLPGRRTTRSP